MRLIDATRSLEGPLEVVGAFRGYSCRAAGRARAAVFEGLPARGCVPGRPAPSAPRPPARSRKLRKRVTKNLQGRRPPELRDPGVGQSVGAEHLREPSVPDRIGERCVARRPPLGAPGLPSGALISANAADPLSSEPLKLCAKNLLKSVFK